MRALMMEGEKKTAVYVKQKRKMDKRKGWIKERKIDRFMKERKI